MTVGAVVHMPSRTRLFHDISCDGHASCFADFLLMLYVHLQRRNDGRGRQRIRHSGVLLLNTREHIRLDAYNSPLLSAVW